MKMIDEEEIKVGDVEVTKLGVFEGLRTWHN